MYIPYKHQFLLLTAQNVLFIFNQLKLIDENEALIVLIQMPSDVLHSVGLSSSDIFPFLTALSSLPPSRLLALQGSAPFIVGAYLHNIASVELSMRRFFAIVM